MLYLHFKLGSNLRGLVIWSGRLFSGEFISCILVYRYCLSCIYKLYGIDLNLGLRFYCNSEEDRVKRLVCVVIDELKIRQSKVKKRSRCSCSEAS